MHTGGASFRYQCRIDCHMFTCLGALGFIRPEKKADPYPDHIFVSFSEQFKCIIFHLFTRIEHSLVPKFHWIDRN